MTAIQIDMVGDPLNAINIFNEYFTDEIVILDIEASKEKLY